MESTTQIGETVNHLFRHEAGKMVSVLTRIFGAHNIELAEDVVQDTLLKALEQWRIGGIPENPTGWLFRVAKNKALDVIRREKLMNSFADDISYLLKSEYTIIPTLNDLLTDTSIADDQLRMMFVCCHSAISEETHVALILKTLCGFSVAEIAAAFLCANDTIEKRLYRGKQTLRTKNIRFELPSSAQLEERLNSVLKAIYLLFNEGYYSTTSENVIREDLVEEALRLVLMLADYSATAKPKVFALAALISLHAARLPSRLDSSGNIILLPEQDRTLWDARLIHEGLQLIARASIGEEISEYHIEAAIASEHCFAPSQVQTNWKHIVWLYDLLYERTASPIAALNRAIAISELEGAEAGIRAIESINDLSLLDNYFLLQAALGELYFRSGNIPRARELFTKALLLPHSPQEAQLLRRKFALT